VTCQKNEIWSIRGEDDEPVSSSGLPLSQPHWRGTTIIEQGLFEPTSLRPSVLKIWDHHRGNTFQAKKKSNKGYRCVVSPCIVRVTCEAKSTVENAHSSLVRERQKMKTRRTAPDKVLSWVAWS